MTFSPPGSWRPESRDVEMMVCTAGHVDHGKTMLIKALTGIDTDRLFLLVFALGAALAGLGGVVAAPVTAANTGMAVSILVPALIVTVIGGMGSIAGAALGAVIVAVIEVLGAAFLPRFGGVLIYAALAAALIWRPEGLLHPKGAR